MVPDSTHPASATIELDRVDGALLAAVRARPGIAAAEARETPTARVQVAPDRWRPLLLFVVPDFDAMQISTFTREQGAWPPPDGTMLVERTREFGVMQTIGGTPRAVRRMVVGEGVLIGALSWVLAIVLALPLSALVNGMVGRPLFNVPLPLVSTPLAMLAWLAVVLIGSAVASAVPAWRASRLTIRETLAYV